MTLFTARDAIHRARLGLASTVVYKCACCKFDQYDANEMVAQSGFEPKAIAEAQRHYGPICTYCFEDFATCENCGNRRRQQDMWNAATCSAKCDADLEYTNYARDERLTWKDAT